MLKLERYETVGWYHAIRGARNPMNSWDRIDSYWDAELENATDKDFLKIKSQLKLGPNDYKLLTRLAAAGPDHGKFMRMITVYVDITAPLYWWKEFDTYKVGTVANSCSTMHKIHERDLTRDDFSTDGMTNGSLMLLDIIIENINMNRWVYEDMKAKESWLQMIKLLPNSYNQKRTVMLNYQVLQNMYNARKNHKLDEWKAFCKWIESLPYSELITGPRI